MGLRHQVLLILCFSSVLVSPTVQAKDWYLTTQAMQCDKLDNCLHFADVFIGDKDFRNSMLEALRQADIAQPSWLPHGVNSPMVPLTVGTHPFLLGSICEPRNCEEHRMLVLYSAEGANVVGLYEVEKHGEQRWFGHPDMLEKKLIRDLIDGDSELNLDMELAKVYPVIVKY